MAFTTNYGIETANSEIPMQASASLVLRKLDFVSSLLLNTDCEWMGGWWLRGVNLLLVGIFFKFLFYNNFHKILYGCVSGLEHLWFSAQRLLGLATFCPLFGQTAA